MAAIHQNPSDVHDADWLEFESLLGELAELAKSDQPFEPLAKQLLNKTVHILAAAGGAVWLGDFSSPIRLVCQTNHDAINPAIGQSFHLQLLELARAEGDSIVVPPGGTSLGTQSVANPTDLTFLIGPLKVDHDIVGLFEIVQRSSCGAAALRGSRRLLGLVCELAADHLRRTELRQLRDDRMQTRKLEDFASRIHGTLDLKSVAYELANAGRQFIDCDRVSVLVRRGQRFDLKAVSSVDTIDQRSNVVRRLEQLAHRIANANEAIWYDGESSEEIAPQVLETLRKYADEAHPRMIGVIPLVSAASDPNQKRSPAAGVLVVEQFNSGFDPAAQQRAESVAKQSGLALINALRFESLPTLPFMRRRHTAIGQPAIRTSTWLALLAGMTLVGSLFFIPTDFNIRSQGELQPEQQQYVFAPFDGQIVLIQVKHGEQVAANDLLLKLRSPEIELESQRIQGEVDTTQQRISAIESSLLQMEVASQPDENRYTQLAAEKEELTQVLNSQRNQLALLAQQREKLVLRSPMAGQILTWDLEQLLSDRPVQRGQSLLNVANLNGPWVAELEVPDDQIGHVLAAQSNDEPISVSFQLATNRGIDYHGVVRRISSRTETTASDVSIVRVTVDVDEQSIKDLRPGSTIFADIHCGRRSVAYVWFHGIYETVLGWLRL